MIDKNILDLLTLAQYEFQSGKDSRAVYYELLLGLNRVCSLGESLLASVDATPADPQLIVYAPPVKAATHPYWQFLPTKGEITWNKDALAKILATDRSDFIQGAEIVSGVFSQGLTHQLLIPLYHGATLVGCFVTSRQRAFAAEEIDVLCVVVPFIGSMMQMRLVEKQRVSLNQELKARQELLETLIKNMPMGVALLDTQNNFILKNEFWDLHFHHGQAKNLLDQMPSMLQKTLSQLVNQSLSQYKTLFTDIQISSKKHISKILEMICSPWQTGSGQTGGVILFCYDVTQERRTQKNLQRDITALKSSNKSLEYYAAVCAHDLREPLRTIANALQILEYEDLSTVEKNKFQQDIAKKCSQMGDLVKKVLYYTSLKHNALDQEPLNLIDLCDEIESEIKSFLEEKNGQIVIDPQTHNETFFADKIQIKQMFQNLILNGLKYNSSEIPTVTLQQKTDGTHWIFEIRDNGIGFSNENLAWAHKIFSSKIPAPEGLQGLGFNIVKRIVEIHKGTINLTSKHEKGSLFVVKIPQKKSLNSIESTS